MFSVSEVEALVNKVVEPYTKLWPLHTLNACNPLIAFESSSFDVALEESSLLLGCTWDETSNIFRKLYRNNAFSLNNLYTVLDKTNFSEKQVLVHGDSLSFQDICRLEMVANLTAKDKSFSQQWSNTQQAELCRVFKANGSNSQTIHQFCPPELMAVIDEYITPSLAANLDDGQALWTMPGKDKSLLERWVAMVGYDRRLPKNTKKKLMMLMDSIVVKSPDAFIHNLLSKLIPHNFSQNDIQNVLNSHAKRLPGWLGYLRYLDEAEPSKQLVSTYMAIRLAYHTAFMDDFEHNTDITLLANTAHKRLERLYHFAYAAVITPEAFIGEVSKHYLQWQDYFSTVPESKQLMLYIETIESAQREILIHDLKHALRPTKQSLKSSPKAQAIFCIDVRSEPYRRVLEASGEIDTFGFAGFFGLPIAKKGFLDTESTDLCPILLKPSYLILEEASLFTRGSWISQLLRKGLLWREQWIYSLKKIKRDTFATFGYVEGLGLIHGFAMVRDNFIFNFLQALTSGISESLQQKMDLKPRVLPTASGESVLNTSDGISIPEQVALAEAILSMTSLKKPYAEFVIICGHAGQAINNPYASTLDCGACGANRGGYNAQVACAILNNSDVREQLFAKGFLIPEHTRFIPAEHNTTTNSVTFLDKSMISREQQESFLKVATQFSNASLNLQKNTTSSNPESSLVGTHLVDVKIAAADWSQTRPEWGLSKNQAFIIGRRSKFKKADLQGRCFLHEYDYESDNDGSILSSIMAAPMVVGAWINLQYLFSTLNQTRFGSGKKYTHNVVGLFGTYQGNQSDLQLGLPYESLFQNDGMPYHYPQRLMVAIESPYDRVDDIIQSNKSLKDLVDNNWIELVIIEPDQYEFIRYQSRAHASIAHSLL